MGWYFAHALIGIIVSSSAIVEGCARYWPMLSTYIAGNEKGDFGYNLIYPTINDCFPEGEDIDIFVEDNWISTGDVLQFTGERRSYVDIGINNDERLLELKELFISMYVYATSGNGTLLHYKAEKAFKNYEISEIKITMVNYHVSVNFCNSGDCEYEFWSNIKTIKQNEGMYISIYRDSKAKLIFDDNEYIDENPEYYEDYGHKDVTFNMIGTVRFGGSLYNDIGDFEGKLQYVTMIPGEKSHKDAVKVFEYFYKNNYHTRRYCSGPVLKYIWPLNNRSLGYEALNHIQPTNSYLVPVDDTTDPVTGLIEQTTSTINDKKVFTSTSNVAYDEEMIDKHCIALFLKLKLPGKRETPTILSITPTSGYYSNLKLTYNKSQIITATMTKYDLSTISVSLYFPDDIWTFVSVQYNWYWDEMSLIVNDTFIKTTLTPQVWPRYSGEMNIEIGGGFDGKMVCLAIFNTPLTETSGRNVLIDACNEHRYYNAPAQDDPEPKRLWPLNKQSEGYEIFYKSNIGNPPDTMCWRYNTASSEHVLDLDAVKFYGSNQFALTIQPINDTDLPKDMFSFGFFFKAGSDAFGTLMEAHMDILTNVHYVLRISLNSGVMNLDIRNSSLRCSSLANLTFEPDKWVSVYVNSENGDYNIFLDNVEHNIVGNCIGVKQMKYIKFVLGNGTDGMDGFLGEMRCLAIYNDTLMPSRTRDILLQACVLNNDPIVTDLPPVTAIDFWRLDDEVKSDKRVHDMSLLSTNQSLYFDGSSRLHVLVNVTIPADDMSIGFFFRAMKYTDGLIIQSEAITSVSGFQVYIRSRKVTVLFRYNCTMLTFSERNIDDENWHWLMISRVRSCSSIIVSLDGDVKYGDSTCFTDCGLTTLRLGGEVKSFNNFRGDLSCLAVFDSPVSPDVGESSLITSCNSLQGQSYTVDGKEHDTTNLLTATKYEVIARGRIPSDTTDPLATANVSSSSRCARECSRTRYCRSFIVHFSVESSTIECTLLSFIRTTALTSALNSDYYALLYSSLYM